MMPGVKSLQLIEEEWLDKVVELAENTMKSSKVYGRQCESGHWSLAKECSECHENTSEILQRAQLSNLQGFANSTDSVKALELFISYQMGRKEGKGWKYKGDLSNSFGSKVVEDFGELGKWAKEIATKSGENNKPIHLWLIRLYTGFLNRWFVALKGGEE
jgi:cytochrome c553